jgi:hypothetical protein
LIWLTQCLTIRPFPRTGPLGDACIACRVIHGRFRESGLFRHMFEVVLQRCMDEGLVGGHSFGVDASLIPANAIQTRGVDSKEGLPRDLTSRAVDEYLETLDDVVFDAATKVVPKFISPADPAARWTGADGGAAYFAYSTNYLVDLDNAVIVDVEPTAPIRPAEARAARDMIDRVHKRFGMKPDKLVGDTGYGSAEMLGWLVEDRQIEPHIPVWDKSKRTDGTFSREDFTYDPMVDKYTCPNGKVLQTYRRNFSKPRKPNGSKDGFIRYRSSKQDCDACPLKTQCCPKDHGRRLMRSVHKAARDVARDIRKGGYSYWMVTLPDIANAIRRSMEFHQFYCAPILFHFWSYIGSLASSFAVISRIGRPIIVIACISSSSPPICTDNLA